MHTFSDRYTLGKFNSPSYANWLTELRTLFPVPDEFLLANAIFSFPNAFKGGNLRKSDAVFRHLVWRLTVLNPFFDAASLTLTFSWE
jgi:hypothetical protein